MAQLRHDYLKFKAVNTEVLVALPNGPRMIGWYVREHQNPYPILSDPGAKAAAQYALATKRIPGLPIFAPGVFLIDSAGKIRYAHYARSAKSEPDNQQPLAILQT